MKRYSRLVICLVARLLSSLLAFSQDSGAALQKDNSPAVINRALTRIDSSKVVPLGQMAVVGDSSLVVMMLNNATVMARLEPMKVVSDTVEYNPASYRLPEDAMLEDLLRKIPGLEISGNTITLHGKPIQQLLIDGQRFFGGKVSAGLQNLSADMISKVKAYERESDFTRTTGIDDGEREPVLDLKIKKSMMDGWRGNINAAYGSLNRYVGRLNANKIKKNEQNTVIGNFNNLPSKININNASRTQLGGGGECDRDRREAGVNVSRKRDKLEFDANVHYDGFSHWRDSKSHSETVYSTGITQYNGKYLQNYANHVPSADARLDWRPNKKYQIVVKPSFKYTYRNYRNNSIGTNLNTAGKFSSDVDNWGRTKQGTLNGGLYFLFTRRFNEYRRGRSLSLNVNATIYRNTFDQPLTYHTINTYNPDGSPKKESDRKIFFASDEVTRGGYAQLAYNEPLGKGFHIQGIVRLNWQLKRLERNTFDMKSLNSQWTVDDPLPYNYQSARINSVCMAGELDWLSPKATLMMRYVKKKITLSAGVSFQPQFSALRYRPSGAEADTLVRSYVSDIAPNVTVTVRPTTSQKISLTYRSYGNSQSIYNLVPTSSGTNPLYLHIGNPDLLPSFVHTVDFNYNVSNLKRQSSFTTRITFRATRNQTSNRQEYFASETTSVYHGVEVTVPKGGTLTVPFNIDGNWSSTASLAYNKAFGNNFSIVQKASANYNNAMSYFYQSKVTETNRNSRLMVKESLDLVFRNDFLEIIGNLNGDYTSEACLLRPDMNQHPWSLGAGLETSVALPWAMRFVVDYSFLLQRGYVFDNIDLDLNPEYNLNRSYHVLNASLSQPLFKKRLILRVEAYDILNQLPNLTRSFGSSSRNIQIYNSYNSYIILRLVYRFKIGK